MPGIFRHYSLHGQTFRENGDVWHFCLPLSGWNYVHAWKGTGSVPRFRDQTQLVLDDDSTNGQADIF